MIGDRMKELRLNKGLSMDEMSKIIGVSSSSVISRYENKQTNPKEKYIIKYADYFGVSVDWLKYGELNDYIYNILEKEMKEKYKSLFDTPIYKKFKKNEEATRSYVIQEREKSVLKDTEVSHEILDEAENIAKRDRLYSRILNLTNKMVNEWGDRKKEKYPSNEDIKSMYLSFKYRSDDTLKTLDDFDHSIIDYLSYQEKILEMLYEPLLSEWVNEFLYFKRTDVEDIKHYKTDLFKLIKELGELIDKLNDNLKDNKIYQVLKKYNNHRDEED